MIIMACMIEEFKYKVIFYSERRGSEEEKRMAWTTEKK